MPTTALQRPWRDQRGRHGASAHAAAAALRGRDARRWRAGARAEERTGQVLDRLGRSRRRPVAVLADRVVPGSSANIDHLVVCPSGVWILDTKSWSGRPRRCRGRLLVGDRDTAVAIESLAWVRERVRRTLDTAGYRYVGIGVGIVVDSPHRVPLWLGQGCCVGDASRVASRIRRRGPLDASTVDAVADLLAVEFPPHPGV